MKKYYDKDYFRKVRSGISVAPSSDFEAIYQICFQFKSGFRDRSKTEKANELTRLSTVKISRPSFAKYIRRRSKKHFVRKGKKCWVCGGLARTQHHIILLRNGGADSGINRIPICPRCHMGIHPWLEG